MWFPYDEGAPKFLKELLCSCKRFPGKSSPCVMFMLPLDKEGFYGMYFLLYVGFFFVAVLPHVLLVVKDKIDVIEEWFCNCSSSF